MPYFNRFDVCEAYYCFACLYHAGQWSEEYKIFGRLKALRFDPGLIQAGGNPSALYENAREIFDGLVDRAGHEPYQEE